MEMVWSAGWDVGKGRDVGKGWSGMHGRGVGAPRGEAHGGMHGRDAGRGTGVRSGRRVRCGVQLRRDARRGEEWSEGMRARGKAARAGGEEAKMACEITSDAILPI